jgi:FeS assembly SUF system regulator
MLRMSKLADYAFILLSQMSIHEDEMWSATALSLETHLPLPTVAKLMKLLSKNGIVTAQRGAAGGYHLARDAKTITIVQIIEAVDGPIGLTECAGMAMGKKVCDCAVTGCPVRESWGRINTVIRGALESVCLDDLAARPLASAT